MIRLFPFYGNAALVTLASFALWGCNKSTSTKSNAPVAEPTVTGDQLATYDLEDPGCQSASNTVPLTGSTISAWDNGALGTPTEAYHDAQSSTSLTTLALSRTSYNDIYERTCDLNLPRGHWCDGPDGTPQGWTRNDATSGGTLRVCQDNHHYGRTSYEGVALTAAAFIQQANDHYRALAVSGGAKVPGALALVVLPQFTDYYDHFIDQYGNDSRMELHVTHNLAYFPDAQMIAVFPETASDAAKEPAFFWESQFVLGHEYGHHIDYTRHGEVLYSVGLRWNPLQHTYDDTLAAAYGLAGPSQRGQLAGALAEGFADMMGFYLGGGSSHTLLGLPTIGADRDVANGTFSSGDPKVLTQDHLNVLYGITSDLENASPAYADIHTIGAIIAHAVDASFDELTAANPALASDPATAADVHYKLALTFMDVAAPLIAGLAVDDQGDAVLAPISAAIEQTANTYLAGLSLTDGGGAARSAVCRVARANLPAMTTVPFANGSGC